MISVNIKHECGAKLPEYKTEGSSGLDLYAFIPDNTEEIISPGEIKLINTGIYIELPDGYEAQVRPRSGLAFKNGITVLNTPGTIDSDYRGEIKVILINLGKDIFRIRNHDRIAQLVITRYEKISWNINDNLNETTRSHGGFGHTGI